MQAGPIHESIKPLRWLLGKWKSIHATSSYPTMKTINYNDNLTFITYGRPIINYNSITWNPETKLPMHMESGFLRIKEDSSNKVAFLIAQGFGVTTIEEGCALKDFLEVKSTYTSAASFIPQTEITETVRSYQLIGENKMEYKFYMATVRTPLTLHIHAGYERFF